MRLATCAGWPGGETPWCGAWWPRPGSNSLYGLSLVGGTKSLLWPQHQYGPMAFTTQLGFGRGCTAGMTFRNLFEDICVQCPGSQVPSKFMSKLLSIQPSCYLPLILLYSLCLTRRHVDSFRGQANIHSSIVSPLVVFRYRVFCCVFNCSCWTSARGRAGGRGVPATHRATRREAALWTSERTES